MSAYILWALAFIHMVTCIKGDGDTTHSRRSVILFVLVTLQALVGIMTLVMQVPVSWALVHQGMALVVLGFAIAHWRGFVGEYALPVEIKKGS